MPHRAGPGDSYKQGGDCKIEWSADPTGKWTDMLIELKTGDNFAMVPLKGTNFPPVRTGGSTTHANSIAITTIDATKQTSYVYPCPQVLSYAIIIRTGD